MLLKSISGKKSKYSRFSVLFYTVAIYISVYHEAKQIMPSKSIFKEK